MKTNYKFTKKSINLSKNIKNTQKIKTKNKN